jgi:uncharacterized membrane protein YgcG
MKLLLLFLSLLIVVSGFAKMPKLQNNTYVNDYAQVLSNKQIKLLNKRIKAFTTKSNLRLSVVLVNRIPEQYTITEYASQIATPDSSLLYVIAVKEDDQCLVSDYSLQFIVDTYSALLLDNLKPQLYQKRYASTVYKFIETVEQHIAKIRAEEQREIAERESSNKVADETVVKSLKAMARLIAIIAGIAVSFSLIVWLSMRVSSHTKSYKNTFVNTENINIGETNIDNRETASVINSSASRSTNINFNPVNDFGDNPSRSS